MVETYISRRRVYDLFVLDIRLLLYVFWSCGSSHVFAGRLPVELPSGSELQRASSNLRLEIG